MWQLPAAEDRPPVFWETEALSRSFPGHWAVLICNQRPKDETQNACSECPSQAGCLPAVRSNLNSLLQRFPPRKNSPSQVTLFFLRVCISLPDQQIYVHFPHQHHPVLDFQVAHVTGTHLSHITGQLGSHRRTEVCVVGTCFVQRHTVSVQCIWDIKVYEDFEIYVDIFIILQQSFLFH